MALPATLSRQSESQQIIRNCAQRLEKILEQHRSGLFRHALTASGLSEQVPLSLPEFDRVLSYVRQVIPGITLELFSSLSLTDLGLVGYAATSADTVGDALQIVNKFHELTSDRYRTVMEVTTDKARIVSVVLSLRLFHRLFLKLIRSCLAEVSRIVYPGGISVEGGALWAAWQTTASDTPAMARTLWALGRGKRRQVIPPPA